MLLTGYMYSTLQLGLTCCQVYLKGSVPGALSTAGGLFTVLKPIKGSQTSLFAIQELQLIAVKKNAFVSSLIISSVMSHNFTSRHYCWILSQLVDAGVVGIEIKHVERHMRPQYVAQAAFLN